MSETKDIYTTARNALRVIRAAVATDNITQDKMQEYAQSVNSLFAKALLENQDKKLLRKEDESDDDKHHFEALNLYVNWLLEDILLDDKGEKIKGLNTAGNPINESGIVAILRVYPTTFKKLLENCGDADIIVLLSTGALALSVMSYLNEIPLVFAAVNKEKTKAYIGRKTLDKKIIIVDDVPGRQVAVVTSHIRKILEGRGSKKLITSDLSARPR